MQMLATGIGSCRNSIIDSNTVLIAMWEHSIDTKTYTTASRNMFSVAMLVMPVVHVPFN